jgi:hypothetical protein
MGGVALLLWGLHMVRSCGFLSKALANRIDRLPADLRLIGTISGPAPPDAISLYHDRNQNLACHKIGWLAVAKRHFLQPGAEAAGGWFR